MKKTFFILALFLFVQTFLVSQSGYRRQKVSEDSVAIEVLFANAKIVDGLAQIDVFFSVPVNPASFTGKNFLVNSKTLPQNTKLVFNREGTQVRFTVNEKFPIKLKIEGVETGGGTIIPAKEILLEE